LDKWVFNSVFRNSHWVGSASMGVSEDDGVVDNHLRVFGIENLRVADASVIPLIPNGNVHSSVVMVANRATQILREDEAAYRRPTASTE
jgi:choline dehydrogenase